MVPRTQVVEIAERIDSDGVVRTPLDESSVLDAIGRLRDIGAEAVAVCLLWATENPAHELAVARLVEQKLPGVFLSLSHEIAPSVGEYARASTTVANAALGPVQGHYLTLLEERLAALGMTAPIMMTTSAGGVVPARTVTERPVSNLLSGPASCVVAGQKLGAELGTPHVLTMDVGGTSFDVGVIAGGVALMSDEVTFGGADMRVPSIDIASIDAGGARSRRSKAASSTSDHAAPVPSPARSATARAAPSRRPPTPILSSGYSTRSSSAAEASSSTAKPRSGPSRTGSARPSG